MQFALLTTTQLGFAAGMFAPVAYIAPLIEGARPN